MCISPIQIKNPYLGLGKLGLNRLHDTVNTYINVPCGHCPACTSLRQTWINQRVQMESLDNYLDLGLTLPFLRALNQPRGLSWPIRSPIISEPESR